MRLTVRTAAGDNIPAVCRLSTALIAGNSACSVTACGPASVSGYVAAKASSSAASALPVSAVCGCSPHWYRCSQRLPRSSMRVRTPLLARLNSASACSGGQPTRVQDVHGVTGWQRVRQVAVPGGLTFHLIAQLLVDTAVLHWRPVVAVLSAVIDVASGSAKTAHRDKQPDVNCDLNRIFLRHLASGRWRVRRTLRRCAVCAVCAAASALTSLGREQRTGQLARGPGAKSGDGPFRAGGRPARHAATFHRGSGLGSAHVAVMPAESPFESRGMRSPRPHRDRGRQPLRAARPRDGVSGCLDGLFSAHVGDRGWLRPLPFRGEPQGAALTLRTQHSPGSPPISPACDEEGSGRLSAIGGNGRIGF